MELQPADWLFCAGALALAVTGLFRGLSGTIAFLAAAVIAYFFGAACWRFLPEAAVAGALKRGVCVAVVSLLAFGIVRFVVKRTVNGLLAQPSDALFGAIVGLGAAALALVAWAWSGFFVEKSSLATAVAEYVL